MLSPSTGATTVRHVAVPTPAKGEVLIRVHAVALNPVDEFYVTEPVAEQDERVVGTDFAGVVVGASSELGILADDRVKEGARVAGFLQGGILSTFHFHVSNGR